MILSQARKSQNLTCLSHSLTISSYLFSPPLRTEAHDDDGGFEALAFDLVDISRQAMTNLLYKFYARAIAAFHCDDDDALQAQEPRRGKSSANKVAQQNQIENDPGLSAQAECAPQSQSRGDKATSSIDVLKRNARDFLRLSADIDDLLATDDNFLLGKWLEDAKAVGANEYERMLYEFNARNQVTLWGPEGNILDYAAKQWSGLIRDYYIPRWRLFFKLLLRAKRTGKPWKQSKFKRLFLEKIGIPFTLERKVYPSSRSGGGESSVRLAKRLHAKWRPRTGENDGTLL